MGRPLPRKNEEKGKLINFKTPVVLKDEDNVFMLSTVENVPVLLPTICSNKEMDVIKLFMNLRELSEIACPLLIITTIQQHIAEDVKMVVEQTKLV